MHEKDQLHRFTIENTNVRGEMVHLDASWQAILERTDYPDNVRAVLGEAMAAVALLSSTIKFEGSLILQIRGDGPLHLLVAQATSSGTLRGIAHWNDEVPSEGLQGIFGMGQMAITIEPDKGEAYQGIIALQGQHLNEAIENYFQQSEQLNTRLWLASNQQTCAGFLLQELPDKKQDDDNWIRASHLASTLRDEEIINLPVKEVLHRLFHEDDVRLYESDPISFRCNCSIERIQSMLLSLGEKETHEILHEQGKIEIDCEFCNAHYEFDTVDIEILFSAPHQPDIPDTHH
ncbi:MAG: Hsp33 family molecular chaperone HslO [Gammaproteobacteria bacterium]|nr:Hsp33 family molecular chaperone HslO [Gammaproteobacteria bacterium]